MKKINGKCHCGNVTYVFYWPGDEKVIPVRSCGCSFCLKRGGTYTAHREGSLEAVVDSSLVSLYQFGTRTAEFYVCARCGSVPFVTSEIDGQTYAVVNVNTFEDIDPGVFVGAVSNFDGESTEARLERRKQNWIPLVHITNRKFRASILSHKP